MEYDIILATRNRKAVLPLSIPLMINQIPKAKNFIIVDSSDNHFEVKKLLLALFGKLDSSIKLKIIHTKAGLTYQRNVGLRFASSDIVFFPDDDSIWFPGYAEAILDIYENDKDRAIGAVMGTAPNKPPPGFFKTTDKIYEIELRDRIAPLLKSLYGPIEKKYFYCPILAMGKYLCDKKKVPTWLHNKNGALQGVMTGFAMSFRKDLISRIKFDESLGQYSLFEDYDASLGVLKTHLIARANNAQVFHYRNPEKRVSGREFGMLHILNRAYVVCKHSERSSKERKLLKRFLYYKLARYLLQTHTQYGRERFQGGLYALRYAKKLMNLEEIGKIQDSYLDYKNICYTSFGQLR